MLDWTLLLPAAAPNYEQRTGKQRDCASSRAYADFWYADADGGHRPRRDPDD